MSYSVDPIARAYATIGLRPGASARQLKEQYKRLVKTWHPDRWGNDPVNQAEAAQRMRMINDAYATLHRVRSSDDTARDAPPPAPTPPADHWTVSHRSMTEDELDAIVRAIGDESWVNIAIRFAAWFVPMAAAMVPLYKTKAQIVFGEPITPKDRTISAALFTTGLVVLIFQKLEKRRRH